MAAIEVRRLRKTYGSIVAVDDLSFDVLDGEVYALYLLKSQHGQGSGKALFQAALEALRFQGKRRVIVWVLALNPTRTFYQRMGGVQTLEKPIEIGGATLLEYGFAFTI